MSRTFVCVNALFDLLSRLTTEAVNPDTVQIDAMTPSQIVSTLASVDQAILPAVTAESHNITSAVDAVTASFRRGGRLVYVGAGTSGRLGILDAAECPPTYGSPPEMVQAVIAGGPQAVFRAVEGAEDDPAAGAMALVTDVVGAPVNENDTVCGISASGRTPFVLGALREAFKRNATTVLVTTNSRDIIEELAPFIIIKICAVTGPEAITGSTRMKSGTAQKLILNMITTASMVLLGKTLGNVMVDLRPVNEKLRQRSIGILMTVGGSDYACAEATLDNCQGNLRIALISLQCKCTPQTAAGLLEKAQGHVRQAIENHLSTL